MEELKRIEKITKELNKIEIEKKENNENFTKFYNELKNIYKPEETEEQKKDRILKYDQATNEIKKNEKNLQQKSDILKIEIALLKNNILATATAAIEKNKMQFLEYFKKSVGEKTKEKIYNFINKTVTEATGAQRVYTYASESEFISSKAYYFTISIYYSEYSRIEKTFTIYKDLTGENRTNKYTNEPEYQFEFGGVYMNFSISNNEKIIDILQIKKEAKKLYNENKKTLEKIEALKKQIETLKKANNEIARGELEKLLYIKEIKIY